MKKFVLIIMCLVGMLLMAGCSNEQIMNQDNPTELHEDVKEIEIKGIEVKEIEIKEIMP